jgi:hypothetical protein
MTESIFSSLMLKERPVHVIGVGSLGAKLALNLYRKGVPELHVWDADFLEARNLFNQPYFYDDIGSSKSDAIVRIARRIYPDSDTRLIPHRENVTVQTGLSGIVLVAVDSNRARYEEVWPCVRENEAVSFFADGRVGIDGGKAFGLDPNNEWHVECYEESGSENPLHNHPDPEDVQPGCKTEFPMPENSDRVAAEMLWRLTQWLHLERGNTAPYMNHIAWCYMPKYAEAHEYWDEEDGSD